MTARPVTLRYGPHHSQRGELWSPGRGVPVVVLLHGGFWRARYTKLLMRRLAAYCARRGWAAWNVEYRRVGLMGGGGGWPATFLDVAAAVDRLATVDGLDLSRVALCGHSAGGHLALWGAGRQRLPSGAPGAGPAGASPAEVARAEVTQAGVERAAVTPCLAVSMAGVPDLAAAARTGLGAGAVRALLGGTPEEQPERYALASPAALLPLGVRQVLVHGTADTTVPPSTSERYAALARAAGDDVVCELVPGAGHRSPIDPAGAVWARVVSYLEAAFA